MNPNTKKSGVFYANQKDEHTKIEEQISVLNCRLIDEGLKEEISKYKDGIDELKHKLRDTCLLKDVYTPDTKLDYGEGSIR